MEEGIFYECPFPEESFISTLVGVALQQGYLHHLDQKWEEFLPEYFTAQTDARKKQMTLRHYLTMTSGLNPDFLAYPGRFGDQSTDWVRFAVEKPILVHPDQLFMYCSPGSHLLSVILTKATGMSTLKFAIGNSFHHCSFFPLLVRGKRR